LSTLSISSLYASQLVDLFTNGEVQVICIGADWYVSTTGTWSS
jgi:hypothetical protein